MFQGLRRILAEDYDHVEAFRRLPPLPEAPRMVHHLRQPGSIWRHFDTPALVLSSVLHRALVLKGHDHVSPP